MQIEKKNDIDIFRIKYTPNKKWSQKFLLMSDQHYDSKYCDRKLLKKHLDYAVENDATILFFGDFFDAMGGARDPRSSKGDIRPEYVKGAYFDAIVNDAVKFLEPYADNIGFMAMGNHEWTSMKNNEVDILQNLCEKLGIEDKRAYSGFVRFNFDRKGESGGSRSSKTMAYSHGHGGSGVSRGVTKFSRNQCNVQADIYVQGHIHTYNCSPLTQRYVNEQGKIKTKECDHVTLPTYKDDSMKGNTKKDINSVGSFSDLKGFPSPNLGCAILEFTYDPSEKTINQTIQRMR